MIMRGSSHMRARRRWGALVVVWWEIICVVPRSYSHFDGFFVGGRGWDQIDEVEAVPVMTPRLGECGLDQLLHVACFGLGLVGR